MGSVRSIFLRADQPVKKYILTELILLIGRAPSSRCMYRQAVPPWHAETHLFALRLHVYNFWCENVRPLNLATRGLRAPPHGKSRPGAAGICGPPDGAFVGRTLLIIDGATKGSID